jgi:hypothetical protein
MGELVNDVILRQLGSLHEAEHRDLLGRPELLLLPFFFDALVLRVVLVPCVPVSVLGGLSSSGLPATPRRATLSPGKDALRRTAEKRARMHATGSIYAHSRSGTGVGLTGPSER